MTSEKLKIKIKRIIVGIVLVVAPITLIAGITLHKTQVLLENNLKKDSLNTLKNIDKGFSQYLRIYTSQMDTITQNKYIREFSTLSNINLENSKYVQEILVNTKDANKEIKTLGFISKSNTIITNDLISDIASLNYIESKWYTDTKKIKGKLLFTIDEKMNSLIISQSVVNKNNLEEGIFFMQIPLNFLNDYINKTNLLETGYVLLFDNKNNVVLGKNGNKDLINSIINQTNKKNSEKNEINIIKSNEEVFYVPKILNSQTEWEIVGVVDGNEIQNDLKIIHNIMALTSLILMILAAIGGIYIISYFSKEIGKLRKIITKVSNGDFSERIDLSNAKDIIKDIGEDFNGMIENISILLEKIQNTSTNLTKTSSEILSISSETTNSITNVGALIDEAANGAENQIRFVKQIHLNAEELSGTINQIDTLSNNVEILGKKTQGLSNSGIEILTDLITKSETANKNTRESSDMVNDVIDSIAQINYISNTISKITEKTKWLALNASIEAARAGDLGNGFSVVAEEIRKLSEESKLSTDKIKNIISEIIIKGNNTRISMSKSDIILSEQNKAIKETEHIFIEIVDSIKPLIESINNIKVLNEKTYHNKEKVDREIENITIVISMINSILKKISDSGQDIKLTTNTLNQFSYVLKENAIELKDKSNKILLK